MLASLTCQIVVITLITNSFLRIIKCKIVIFIPQLYVKVWCTLSLIFFSTTPLINISGPKRWLCWFVILIPLPAVRDLGPDGDWALNSCRIYSPGAQAGSFLRSWFPLLLLSNWDLALKSNTSSALCIFPVSFSTSLVQAHGVLPPT